MLDEELDLDEVDASDFDYPRIAWYPEGRQILVWNDDTMAWAEGMVSLFPELPEGAIQYAPIIHRMPRPVIDEPALERIEGPDGLMHYDCPMGLGQEPCRCGARAAVVGQS